MFWLLLRLTFVYFFFFNDTATTEIYTLSLHDALPIFSFWCSLAAASAPRSGMARTCLHCGWWAVPIRWAPWPSMCRSEEHTSELQSQSNLVCRLLLEKKKKIKAATTRSHVNN